MLGKEYALKKKPSGKIPKDVRRVWEHYSTPADMNLG